MPKKLDLDDATIAVMKRMLGTPPKPHNEMKVGRPKKEKKRWEKTQKELDQLKIATAEIEILPDDQQTGDASASSEVIFEQIRPTGTALLDSDGPQ